MVEFVYGQSKPDSQDDHVEVLPSTSNGRRLGVRLPYFRRGNTLVASAQSLPSRSGRCPPDLLVKFMEIAAADDSALAAQRATAPAPAPASSPSATPMAAKSAK